MSVQSAPAAQDFGGPIFLRIDNGGEETFALSREVAERIWVE
jgi:hypothetical protein